MNQDSKAYKKLLGFFLILYIFSLPLSISVIDASSLALSCICIYLSFTQKNFFKSVDMGPLLWSLSPFIVWGISSSLLYSSYELPIKMEMIKNHSNLIFLWFLPPILWLFWKQIHVYSKYMVILIGIVSLYGLLQFFTGWAFDGQEQFSILKYEGHLYYRVRGFFNNTMTYNYVMVAFFFWLYFDCFSHFIKKGKGSFLQNFKNQNSNQNSNQEINPNQYQCKTFKIFQVTKFICLCALSLSLMLTLTRSFLVFLPLTLLILTPFFYGYKSFLFTLLVTLFLGACLYSTNLFQNRFSPEIKKDHSFSYRLHLWHVHWKMFLESPIKGKGLSQKVSNKYLEPYYKEKNIKPLLSHAHNNILSILAGMGMIGLLAYGLIMGYFLYLAFILYKYKRNIMLPWEKNLLKAILGFMLIFHLGGMLESNFLDGEPFHVLLLSFSMLLVLRQLYFKDSIKDSIEDSILKNST